MTTASRYKSDFPNAKVKRNNKLYKGKFPHVINCFVGENVKYFKERDFLPIDERAFWKALEEAIPKEDYSRRYEWYNFRIYVKELAPFLKIIKDMGAANNVVEIAEMPADVIEHYATATSETYKTVTTVVRSLPYKKYRYRIHIPNSMTKMRGIGQDNLESINSYLKTFDIDASKVLTNLRWYQSNRYFYSENLDWLPIIMLIDSRIIVKIENFITEEEVANKQTN